MVQWLLQILLRTVFQIPYKGRVSTGNFERSINVGLPTPSQVYQLFCRVRWPTFLGFWPETPLLSGTLWEPWFNYAFQMLGAGPEGYHYKTLTIDIVFWNSHIPHAGLLNKEYIVLSERFSGQCLTRLRVVSNFGISSEIHARAKMGSREETCHEGRRQKLETTDKARDFDCSWPSDFEV